MLSGLNKLLKQIPGYSAGNRSGMGRTGEAPPPGKPSRIGSERADSRSITQKDGLHLSQTLQDLLDSGLDFEGSTIRQNAQMVTFDLRFEDQQIRSATSNGHYDLRSQSMQLDFSFRSALTIQDPESGEERREIFQFDLHLEANQVGADWGDKKVEKEDIMQFARKILKKISKLYAEGKKIDGLVLGEEDMKELGSVDEGRLLKGIVQVIDLMRTIDRFRSRKGDHVLLMPEREKAVVSEQNKLEEQSMSLSLSVRRISVESSQALTSEAPSAEVIQA